ncbi:putative LTR transposable element, partial [Pseudoloma neurophilia]
MIVDIEHEITLICNDTVVYSRPYRRSPEQNDIITNQIQKWLELEIIRHSNSKYASPVILVRKKDGGWRLCVDYRKLNALTV